MKRYVDGFVIVVKKGKLNEYKKMAEIGAREWKKHGALEYFECVGDDLNPDMKGMKALMFPKMTKQKKGESIIFSFIVYKSKKHRDTVNKKVMNEMDKAMVQFKNMIMPFDMKKMAYGGFKTI